MRVADISVSRMHAEIRRYDDEFYLVDLSSKFGTLMLANRPLRVRGDQTLALQAGRTLLRLSVCYPSVCLCFKYNNKQECEIVGSRRKTRTPPTRRRRSCR